MPKGYIPGSGLLAQSTLPDGPVASADKGPILIFSPIVAVSAHLAALPGGPHPAVTALSVLIPPLCRSTHASARSTVYAASRPEVRRDGLMECIPSPNLLLTLVSRGR
jgi:hypothetical protein